MENGFRIEGTEDNNSESIAALLGEFVFHNSKSAERDGIRGDLETAVFGIVSEAEIMEELEV